MESPGINDDQKKKLAGVIIKAKSEVKAVRVTESATFPPASNEKKLEAFPPGHAATKIIPSAMPGAGVIINIIRHVSAGNIIYCETKPVTKAFFEFRN